jgi:hypothetical protein
LRLARFLTDRRIDTVVPFARQKFEQFALDTRDQAGALKR